MTRTANRVLCWAILASLSIAFAAVERPASAADAPVRKALAKRTRRLPSHYAAVVNEEQRQKIYQIQEEYRPKIDALQSQLDSLKKERAEKISAVLTEEQKEQIDEAAAKAKQQRKAAKSAEKASDALPAEQKPAE